jgi:transposase-like protein
MNPCPYCQANTRQVKAGLTQSGSQRYRCQHCKRRHTPQPKQAGYPDLVRQQAVQMYIDGVNYRRIGRLLKVDHVTVMHWVRAQANQTPATPPTPPRPPQTTVIEMDELFTSIGAKRDKKTGSTSSHS